MVHKPFSDYKQVQVRGYSADDQPVRQPAKVVWLAALTTGTSNGCLLGLAVVFLATKWLPALVNEVNSAFLVWSIQSANKDHAQLAATRVIWSQLMTVTE